MSLINGILKGHKECVDNKKHKLAVLIYSQMSVQAISPATLVVILFFVIVRGMYTHIYMYFPI